MKRLALLTLAAVAALAPVSAAEAAKKPVVQKARFKAQLEGVQTNAWSAKHTGTGDCDVDSSGKGTEVARFKAAPFTLRVTYFKGLSNPVIVTNLKSGSLYRPLPAKVTRQGKLSVAPTPRHCQGTDKGTPRRECGTKRLTGGFALGYGVLSKNRIELTHEPRTNEEPFVGCPHGQYPFPLLLDQNTSGKKIAPKLPKGEVFNRRIGKIIVLGRGKKITTGAETRDETTISWKLTLRRLGKRK